MTGMSAEDAAWMAALPFSLSVPSRRFIVAHAGLVPGVPLSQQPLDAMYTVRSFRFQSLFPCEGVPSVTLTSGVFVIVPLSAPGTFSNAYRGFQHCEGHAAVLSQHAHVFAAATMGSCSRLRSMLSLLEVDVEPADVRRCEMWCPRPCPTWRTATAWSTALA